MNKFEANKPEQLKAFLIQFRMLLDEFHPNIYLIDEVFEGANMIEKAIESKLNTSHKSNN